MATNSPTGTTNQGSNRLEGVDASNAVPDNTETRSNADLYIVTPPAYTQSIAEGETSVDAELIQPEKPAQQPKHPPRHESPIDVPLQRASSLPVQLEAPYQDEPQLQTSPHTLTLSSPITPPTAPPVLHHYLTEPYATAALVGARPCSILPDRPAIWLVRNKKIALSPLAAAVIVKEGLIAPKELVLITPYSAMRRDPTDPISGVLLGTYDGVGEIMLGLVAGPIELGRQKIPGVSQTAVAHECANVNHNADVAAKVAVETGKGLGRIVTGALKTPVLVTNGLTRGFHNLPKLYGEQVREYENVTGLRSGLTSFGYGLSDGLVDLFAKPVQGAERDGLAGFASGIAKGLGNAIFKPTAGACGLVGYSAVGLYKSVRHNSLRTKDEVDPIKVILELGGEEYSRATDADRLYIVRVWCQNMMRVRLV